MHCPAPGAGRPGRPTPSRSASLARPPRPITAPTPMSSVIRRDIRTSMTTGRPVPPTSGGNRARPGRVHRTASQWDRRRRTPGDRIGTRWRSSNRQDRRCDETSPGGWHATPGSSLWWRTPTATRCTSAREPTPSPPPYAEPCTPATAPAPGPDAAPPPCNSTTPTTAAEAATTTSRTSPPNVRPTTAPSTSTGSRSPENPTASSPLAARRHRDRGQPPHPPPTRHRRPPRADPAHPTPAPPRRRPPRDCPHAPLARRPPPTRLHLRRPRLPKRRGPTPHPPHRRNRLRRSRHRPSGEPQLRSSQLPAEQVVVKEPTSPHRGNGAQNGRPGDRFAHQKPAERGDRFRQSRLPAQLFS